MEQIEGIPIFIRRVEMWPRTETDHSVEPCMVKIAKDGRPIVIRFVQDRYFGATVQLPGLLQFSSYLRFK